jgi:hypothetical protein
MESQRLSWLKMRTFELALDARLAAESAAFLIDLFEREPGAGYLVFGEPSWRDIRWQHRL